MAVTQLRRQANSAIDTASTLSDATRYCRSIRSFLVLTLAIASSSMLVPPAAYGSGAAAREWSGDNHRPVGGAGRADPVANDPVANAVAASTRTVPVMSAGLPALMDDVSAAGAGPSGSSLAAAAPQQAFQAPWRDEAGWPAANWAILALIALAVAMVAIRISANRGFQSWFAPLAELMQRVGGGDGSHALLRSQFADAPPEVRNLSAELHRLGDNITDREQRLRRSIADQAEVTREMHHRVRNNLQIMESFLSLQVATLVPGPARHAINAARLRVATMAMVNSLLYADSEQTMISLETLLTQVAALLARHTGFEGALVINPDRVSYDVGIDSAMPLALWTVEAGACLFARNDTASGSHRFAVEATSEDDVICIVMTVHGPVPLPLPPANSLHRRLVTAIAHQLGGRSRIEASGTSGARIVLCLPCKGAIVRHGFELSDLAAGIAA